MSVICVCLSPGFQRSVIIDSLIPGEVNRLKSVVVDAAGKGVNVCRVLQRLDIRPIWPAWPGSQGCLYCLMCRALFSWIPLLPDRPSSRSILPSSPQHFSLDDSAAASMAASWLKRWFLLTS